MARKTTISQIYAQTCNLKNQILSSCVNTSAVTVFGHFLDFDILRLRFSKDLDIKIKNNFILNLKNENIGQPPKSGLTSDKLKGIYMIVVVVIVYFKN